ncbi:unnamed protein product, partial [Scytosiphon promiscuus]
RGCVEAISACLEAIAAAHAAQKQDPRLVAADAAAEGAFPPLLQTSKGSGTTECRDSARELLRFFGHSTMLHAEGVIWVKPSGTRVHCLAAVSDRSLFLVPLRDPSFIGGVFHGFQKAKHAPDQIVQVPLHSILDVAIFSGREHLKTFRNVKANSVSRPFRIVTTREPESCKAGRSTSDTQLSTRTASGLDEYQILLVGFEDICRLRHILVLACESWAVRIGSAVGAPPEEMLSCVPVAAQQYLAEVFETISGPLRNKVDIQVDLMEGLANEMISDPVVKEVFFSTGDIFFEIAQRLEAAATHAVGELAIAAARKSAAGSNDNTRVKGWNQHDVIAEARRVSAVAAVLDAAFFHSMGSPRRVELVGRPKPTSLPAVAENLFCVYSALQSRIISHSDTVNDSSGIAGGNAVGNGVASASVESSVAGHGGGESPDAMLRWDGILTGVLDRVVRAINGMSNVISLFNIENEHLGVVRNLVGVGLGMKVRAGIQPAASDAQAFLARVNDRVVSLIENLHRREQNVRQLEAEQKLALGPIAVSPASGKGGHRKSFFLKLASLSPSSRSRRSQTPPLTPASPTRQPPGSPPPVFGDRGVGLQHLLGRRPTANDRGNGAGISQQRAAELRWRKEQDQPPPTPSLLPRERCCSPQQSSPREFLRSPPVLLHSYAKLLNALVCGSYNLREAYFSSCEVDIRNIGRPGGYLDMLADMDGGTPRLLFRQIAVFLEEILIECHL